MKNDNNISDELIARYLSGKASEDEEALVLEYISQSDEFVTDLANIAEGIKVQQESETIGDMSGDDISDEVLASFLSGMATEDEEAAVLAYMSQNDENLEDLVNIADGIKAQNESSEVKPVRRILFMPAKTFGRVAASVAVLAVAGTVWFGSSRLDSQREFSRAAEGGASNSEAQYAEVHGNNVSVPDNGSKSLSSRGGGDVLLADANDVSNDVKSGLAPTGEQEQGDILPDEIMENNNLFYGDDGKLFASDLKAQDNNAVKKTAVGLAGPKGNATEKGLSWSWKRNDHQCKLVLVLLGKEGEKIGTRSFEINKGATTYSISPDSVRKMASEGASSAIWRFKMVDSDGSESTVENGIVNF